MANHTVRLSKLSHVVVFNKVPDIKMMIYIARSTPIFFVVWAEHVTTNYCNVPFADNTITIATADSGFIEQIENIIPSPPRIIP